MLSELPKNLQTDPVYINMGWPWPEGQPIMMLLQVVREHLR